MATSRVWVRGFSIFDTRREREIGIHFVPEGTFRDDLDVLIAPVLLASKKGEWKKARSQSTLSLAQLNQAISVARLEFAHGQEDDGYREDDTTLGTLENVFYAYIIAFLVVEYAAAFGRKSKLGRCGDADHGITGASKQLLNGRRSRAIRIIPVAKD